ncbi:MAG TPA: metallophosphoesterase family protein [Planctomycetaceae bacterium]
MRVLVLGDIHSNWAALSAVAAAEPGPFDACLVTGDLVDYGSDPIPCMRWVRQHATAVVRGNHDHAVAQRVAARAGSGFKSIAAATRPLHWQVLGREEMKFLARLPVTCRLTVGDRTFFLVHATPRDPMDEYLNEDRNAWAARLEFVEADYVLVGHTHVPYVLDLGKTVVLNPGSVGQPRDGDPRAAYAVIEDGRVELRRVEYDVDAAVEHLRASGVRGEPLAAAERALRTGGAG